MSENVSSASIEQLLSEADELIHKINSDAAKDLQAEHRLQVEEHAQYLKKIKSEVQDKLEKKEKSKLDHGAEGMHEAIQEISKAMGELAKYLA